MHQKLNTPNSICCRICAAGDGPWWELFGKCADMWPVSGSCVGGYGGACDSKFCDLRFGEEGGNQNEAIAL